MDILDIGIEIASGTLRIGNDNHEAYLKVTVGRPQRFENASGYYCPFEIEGLPIRFGAGEDEIQAIEIALRNLKAELCYLNTQIYQGRLCWSNGDTIAL